MPYVLVTPSPRGHRSGLFHYALGGCSITVLVHPKAWKSSAAPARPVVDLGEGGRHVLVLYEVDRVALKVSKTFADFLTTTVQGSINESVRVAAKKAREARARGGPRPSRLPKYADDPDTDDSDSDDSDEDAVLNELVNFSPGKGDNAPADFELPASDTVPGGSLARPEVNSAAEVGRGLISLIHLASRCRRSTNLWTHEADAEAGSGGAIGEHGDRRALHDPLALLSQWLFVEQMEARLRKVRRGYVPVVETSCVVRGRPTMRGMIQQAAMGTPWIECARDEFTEATPLFRVLVTALEHVASGAIAAMFGLSNWNVAADLAKKATQVRRMLQSISALPLPVAANQAGRIRLTRAQKEWERPVELARQILRVEPPKAGTAGDGEEAAQFWFDTSKFWEDVVFQALEDHWAWRDEQSKDKPLDVWIGVGASKRPDFIVSVPRPAEKQPRTVVVDAKYKAMPGKGRCVDASDQYQTFAYSMLCERSPWSLETETPAPDTVALVFPLPTLAGGARAPDPVHLKPASRGPVHTEQGPAHLLRVGLPFPSHNDTLSPAAWQAYLREVGQALSSHSLPHPPPLPTPPPQSK